MTTTDAGVVVVTGGAFEGAVPLHERSPLEDMLWPYWPEVLTH